MFKKKYFFEIKTYKSKNNLEVVKIASGVVEIKHVNVVGN